MRTGNAASAQVQLDVYGEVMDALHQARLGGMAPDPTAWALQQALIKHVERHWTEPDEGIWEVRSGRRHFTHSKVMAWVAIDRAVRAVERSGLDGPVEHWRKLRSQMHAEVCQRGLDPGRGCFVRAYGSAEVDASLLLLPLVGFLPPGDERVVRTLKAVQDELCEDGFVRRYRTDEQGAGRRRGWRRGCLPGLQLLAGGQPRPARPPAGGEAAVRAAS
ncbi:MAG TPA: glycoside hydrolase family 15 protein [Streptosporangiaceae bacterium]